MPEALPARLVLADGRVFHGRSFGAPVEVAAEVVFNTSHTGYQEVLTDPSYRFQAVTFTVPILGIYGVTDDEDDQSAGPQAAAMICREVSRKASNQRSKRTLHEHLLGLGIPGIDGVDTRTLTKHLRDHGSQNGVVTTCDDPDAVVAERARNAPDMNGLDLAKEVTTKTAYRWDEPFRAGNTPGHLLLPEPYPAPGSRGHVVVVDFGVKRDILRHMVSRGLSLTVVPGHTQAGAILEMEPDGILLSNGPGDPAAVGYGIAATRELLKAVGNGGPPLYGVCLGHQILSLAAGATTRKLKFGHRGANHPCRDHETGKVVITAQNHGFAVDPSTLGKTPLVQTHTSLFDGACEGVAHKELPVRALQYHPEAGPGPHEAADFFDHFVKAIAVRRAPAAAGRA